MSLILIGGSIFIFVLGLSAYFEPDIRWLHFFQAWMYLAAMGLALRRNRWGYFIGVSAAGFWDYSTIFVNTFFPNGMRWLFAWISSGQLKHEDQIIAVPAWIANLLVVIGSLWAYGRLAQKPRTDVARLALAFACTTGFFALAIAWCQPRYLPIFRGALHPHWPW